MEKEKYLNVARPHKTCLLCGRSLAGVDKHPSILTKWEDEAVRKDYCPQCWEKLTSKDYFCYWITKRLQPAPNKQLSKKERNNLLLRLFESLYETADESRAYTLFFLAHLLMRYKVFKWKGTREIAADPDSTRPTQTLLIFENKLTGEEIQLPDQSLEGEKLAEVKKEIDEYLQTNLPEELLT